MYYLKKRNITLKTAGKFNLGFSNELDFQLNKFIKKNGVSKQVILKISRLHSNGFPIFYSERIIFPIFKNEKPISFTGRSLNDVDTKHMHTRGPLNGFYNHDRLFECDTIYVTEGPFDCLSLEQLGYPSIALLRCRHNPANNRCFSKIKKVVLLLDNDPNGSGQNGSIKMASDLLIDSSLHLDVMLATLPPNTDCNQLCIEKKPYEIRSAIRNAVDFRYTMEYKNALKKSQQKTESTQHEEKIYNISLFDVVEYYLGNSIRESDNKSFYICPFHSETNPSFVVYHDTNTYYCFGCGAVGNQKTFIANMEKISYKSADQILERICENGCQKIPRNT
jgi:DNA primase